MTISDAPLSPQDLADLRRALETAGWPRGFPPGPTDRQLRAQSREAGIVLPQELLTWFSWTDLETGSISLVPYIYTHTFKSAVAERAFFRTLTAEGIEDGIPEEAQAWQPHWLPLANNAGSVHLLADISGPVDGPVRVASFAWWSEDMTILAPSLGRLARGWTAALTAGAYTWGATHWDIHPGRAEPGTDVWSDDESPRRV